MTPAECRAIRKSLGETYQGFARGLGVSKTTILNWETAGPSKLAAIVLALLRDNPALWRSIARTG